MAGCNEMSFIAVRHRLNVTTSHLNGNEPLHVYSDRSASSPEATDTARNRDQFGVRERETYPHVVTNTRYIVPISLNAIHGLAGSLRVHRSPLQDLTTALS